MDTTAVYGMAHNLHTQVTLWAEGGASYRALLQTALSNSSCTSAAAAALAFVQHGNVVHSLDSSSPQVQQLHRRLWFTTLPRFILRSFWSIHYSDMHVNSLADALRQGDGGSTGVAREFRPQSRKAGHRSPSENT